MGRAYVSAFAARGAQVVGIDRSWDSPVENVLALTAEITSADDVDRVTREALDHFGRIDVLVANAAMRQRDLYPPHGASAVLDTADTDWQRMFEVNVVGVLKVIRACARPMLEQNSGGSIVVISSGGGVGRLLEEGVWVGRNPAFRNQPYEASKAAVTSMTFSLAAELQSHNVAVNAVFPAGTRTTGSDEMVAGRAQLGIRVSQLMRPEHVVPVVLFLASQRADGVSGQAIDAVQWNVRNGFGGPEAWQA
jgi:NAD(P)-dependent dehydrogenase (short-subunit alcohol dehydrogenase family)